MSNVSIVDQLREMRLTAMAREFEAQSQDPATYSQIPFEERFGLIVNAGWNSQQTSKLRRRIHDAHLDIIEARTKHGATIFCTQYDPYSDWYERLNTDPAHDSPISDAIMDRIYHNSYVVSVEGKVSMRARHGLKPEQNSEAAE